MIVGAHALAFHGAFAEICTSTGKHLDFSKVEATLPLPACLPAGGLWTELRLEMLVDSASDDLTPDRRLVLLIDDDEFFVHFTCQSLERAGFAVDVVRDGKAGLRAALTGRHDVIVLDHNLPGLLGIDVLRALTARPFQTPVIIVTGEGNESVAFEAAQLGAFQYLTKPLSPGDLIESIRTAVDAAKSEPADCPHDADSQGGSFVPGRQIHWRWAKAMLGVIRAPEDLPTLERWAAHQVVFPGALRNCCARLGVPAKASLDLARGLRAVVQARLTGDRPEDCLDSADLRTARHLLLDAGADGSDNSDNEVTAMLRRQKLISNRFAIEELERLLIH